MQEERGGTGFRGVRFRYLLSAVLSAVCGFGTFKCGFMCGLRFLPIIQRLRFYLEKCSRFAVSNENLNRYISYVSNKNYKTF